MSFAIRYVSDSLEYPALGLRYARDVAEGGLMPIAIRRSRRCKQNGG